MSTITAPPTHRTTIEAAMHRATHRKGLVIVNTGNGKGKSTAAFGLMTRAWGRGMRVAVVQFIKVSHAQFGEQRAATAMGIDWVACGDGFTWTSEDLAVSAELARQGWQVAQAKITSEQFGMVILDEFTYPLCYGWLDTAEVIAWLTANKPPDLHLAITGRDAPPALIAYADLVTEMVEIKHPYREQGVKAQAGIEY